MRISRSLICRLRTTVCQGVDGADDGRYAALFDLPIAIKPSDYGDVGYGL